MYVKVSNQKNELAKCLNLSLTIFRETWRNSFSEHQLWMLLLLLGFCFAQDQRYNNNVKTEQQLFHFYI